MKKSIKQLRAELNIPCTLSQEDLTKFLLSKITTEFGLREYLVKKEPVNLKSRSYYPFVITEDKELLEEEVAQERGVKYFIL